MQHSIAVWTLRPGERRLLTAALAVLILAVGVATARADEVGLYRIDVPGSDIHWLVYRAGAFARFGHNHIISVGEAEGTVEVHPDPAQSSFELTIPARGLVVDDAALWQREQTEGFETLPSPDDIAGTRRNMLGADVLDAEQHPFIRLTGSGLSTLEGEGTLDVTIEILGRGIPLTLPVVVTTDGETLEASGSFRLTHGELGMRPFSVMMGALQVADHMDFRYRIRAARIGQGIPDTGD